ncbi:hypothetical protein BJY00DRAFT_317993 [Aspergillus carlsbadensis]|nr:hypothetical protein BJY00DRAFT_317993 [Aspergillus carlsbadensis]
MLGGSRPERQRNLVQNVKHSELKPGLLGRAQHNKPPFRLLHLPAEIRQMIYRFVLGDQNIRARHYEDYSRNDSVPDEALSFRFRKDDIATHLQELHWFEKNAQPRHPGRQTTMARLYGGEPVCLNLLLANRQIYNEAREIPYSSNTFAFAQAHVFRLFISPWASGCPVDSCMKLIRRIVFFIPLFAEATVDDRDPIPSLTSYGKSHCLKGLQEVRLVIGRRKPEGERWEMLYADRTDLRNVYDLFAFSKENVSKIRYEVLLEEGCDESERERARAYERLLEAKAQAPGYNSDDSWPFGSDGEDEESS